MIETAATAALWLYYQCAWFMVNAAALTGATYRDANAALLFIIWPAATVGLLLWVGHNTRTLRRLRRRAVRRPGRSPQP